jgi:hypothetical protein
VTHTKVAVGGQIPGDWTSTVTFGVTVSFNRSTHLGHVSMVDLHGEALGVRAPRDMVDREFQVTGSRTNRAAQCIYLHAGEQSTRSTAETTLRRSLRRLARRPPLRRRRDGHEPSTGHLRRGLVEPPQRAISKDSADPSAGLYGHCPLFTHPAAGWAFTVGAANDVAIVTAGGSKVAVAPMLISVGSTFMAGTVGDA